MSAQRRVTPEILGTMVDLLPVIGSLRDLCAITGLRLDAVRRETAPFRAIMKLQGTHPQCGCGRDRFHPYGCVDSYAKADQNPIPGHRVEDHAAILEKRRRAIDMLVRGERLVDIDSALGLLHKDAGKYRRFLTTDQLEARRRAISARGAEVASKTQHFKDHQQEAPNDGRA